MKNYDEILADHIMT